MRTGWTGGFLVALVSLCLPPDTAAQTTARRLTTIGALRQFPAYYHLQNVLLRGEFAENGRRLLLRGDTDEIGVQLAADVNTVSGAVEVRGQLIDVGRLEPGDPRVGTFAEGRDAERWPRPGEELFVRATLVAAAQPATSASVRAVALEPWRFAGQRVTVTGNFRGRNLFGDLPDAPGQGRYDFVLRAADGAVWVTGLRPRGRGFDLDVNRRVDTSRWLSITGTLQRNRGLVLIEATTVNLAEAPTLADASTEPEPPRALPEPVEVVFSAPIDGESEVSPTSSVRVQFSRGLAEASLASRIRVSYVDPSPVIPGSPPEPALEFKATYDGANRAVEIRFSRPLDSLRMVRVELLAGVTGFDGGPVQPWTVTFLVGT